MPEPQPMMKSHKLAPPEHTAFEAVLRLLRLEWDPTDTDGVPDDDYESQALALFWRLRHGATVMAATDYLGAVETLELGLPERRARNAAIAAKAHALVVSLSRPIGEQLRQLRMTSRQRGTFEWIRRLLRKEWEPVGIGANGSDDEYDPYALQLYMRLMAGESVADAAAYLSAVERLAIGLPERPLLNVEMAAKAHTIVAELRRYEELDELRLEWMTPRQREALAALKILLRHEWNPIDPGGHPYELGGLPEDEYETYAPTLFTLIDRGGTVEEAVRFLAVMETAHIGLRERPEVNATVGAKAHAIVMAAQPEK